MMNIELRHLRYFVAVAEELHFSRAANVLGLAQPPLSQQIQQLERAVGQQLFVRRPTVRLTKAGEAFLLHARKTLSELTRAVDAARRVGEGSAGQLSVAFAASTLLSPLADALRVYRAERPDVELSVTELSTAPQMLALQERRIDVGFMRMPREGTAGVALEELHDEPFAIALPPDHPLGGRSSVEARELEREPFVLFPRDIAPGLHDQIHQLFAAAGYRPTVVMEAREWFTVLGLVAAGIGVSIVPASFRRLRWGDVTYATLAGASETTRIFVGRSTESSNPALPHFLEVVRRVFGKDAVAADRS